MRNNPPIVSVIIPVWNTEKYLEKCLNSIVAQTLKDIEIICVDNDSEDSSPQIINKFAQNDSRFKVIKIKHSCISTARNAGLSVATAPYVSFVDSDDWIEPDTYKAAVEKFEKDSDVDIVCWGANIVKEEKNSYNPYFSEAKKYHKIRIKKKKKLSNDIILRSNVCVWNKMFKNNIIKNNNIIFPEGLELEDNSFYFTYIKNCRYGYFINKYYYNYLQRNNSNLQLIQSKKSTIIAPHLKNLKFIMEYYKKNKVLDKNIPLICKLFEKYLNMDLAWTNELHKKQVIDIAAELCGQLKTETCIHKSLFEAVRERSYDEVYKILSGTTNKICGNKIIAIYKNEINNMYQMKIFNKNLIKFKLNGRNK